MYEYVTGSERLRIINDLIEYYMNFKKPKVNADFSIFLTFYLALLEYKLEICNF